MMFPNTHQGYPLTVSQVEAPPADAAAFEPKGRCLSQPLYLQSYFIAGFWPPAKTGTRYYKLTVKLPVI